MKVIARLLYRLKRSGIPFRLAAWHCGTAENFNPLDGAVTLTADAPQKQVNALLEAEFAVLDKEIADARYAGQMHIETGVRAQKALSAEDSAALLTLLWLMPNNLYHATESEALTINNVGLLSLESGVFHAAASCRSCWRRSAPACPSAA